MPYIANKKNNINFNNRGQSKDPEVSDGFFLLSEAAQKCSYTQEYLSLLARKGDLRAKKIGRNWYTRIDWLREYIDAHPAQKKGNVKGEILIDQKYKKQIQQSPLTESVDSYSRKVKENLLDATESFLDRIKNIFKQAATRVGVFVLFKKRPSKKVLSIGHEIDLAHLVIHGELEKIFKNQIEDLAEAVEKSIPRFDFRKVTLKSKVNYPFGVGSNKCILEAAEENIMSAVETVRFNVLIWLVNFIKNKIAGYTYAFRFHSRELAREPVVVARHWRAVTPMFRVRVLATSMAVIAMMMVTVYSQIDYKGADGAYTKATAMYEQGKQLAQAGTKKVISVAQQIQGIKTRNYVSKPEREWQGIRIAGEATVDFKNLFVDKTLVSLNNVNRALENINRGVVKADERDVKMASSWMLKAKDVPVYLAKYFGGQEIEQKVEFGDIARGFIETRDSLSDEILNGYLAKRSDKLFDILSSILTDNFGNLPGIELDNVKMKLAVKRIGDKGEALNLACKNYISEDVSQKIIDEKIKKLGRLGVLIEWIYGNMSENWEIAKVKLSELFGEARVSLGDGYLAFLDALNLQTKYTNYGTEKTLMFGDGDDPLELIKVPAAAGLEEQGLAIVPVEDKAEEERRELARDIQNTFSDEVEVIPDGDTATGVIRPKDTEVAGVDYMYVFVPIAKEEVSN